MRRRVAYTRRVLRFAGSFSRGIHYETAVKKPQDDTPRVRGKRRRSDSTRVTREPSHTARRGAARRGAFRVTNKRTGARNGKRRNRERAPLGSPNPREKQPRETWRARNAPRRCANARRAARETRTRQRPPRGHRAALRSDLYYFSFGAHPHHASAGSLARSSTRPFPCQSPLPDAVARTHELRRNG